MVLTLKKLPLPEKPTQVPIYITKVVSVDKICLRFISHMDEYVMLVKEVQSYFSEKTSHCYISSLKSASDEDIKDRLFILKREDVYHRVRVSHIWPSNKTFMVHLLDEGFDCIAGEQQLILNDNSSFLSKPSQAFVFPLDIERTYNRRLDYVINYGLQKVVNSKTNFFATVSPNGQIILYFKEKSGNLISINDYLRDFIQATDVEKRKVDEAVEIHLEPILKNNPSSIVAASEKLSSVVSTKQILNPNAPRFELPWGEMLMKCKHIFSPSDFYLKLKKTSDFVKFIDEMNQFYQHNKVKLASPVLLNNLYITNFKDKWTRLFILGMVKDHVYSCLLFDKGIVGSIDGIDIYELDERFKKMPPRAVKACLAFVKPKGDGWSREAIEYFKNEVKSCLLTVYPINFGTDGIFYCSLVKGDDNLSDHLHRRGFALIDI